MNKRQARQEALKILLAMIDQEIGSPTGFTDKDYEGNELPQDWDMKLVQNALDELGDQLGDQLENKLNRSYGKNG